MAREGLLWWPCVLLMLWTMGCIVISSPLTAGELKHRSPQYDHRQHARHHDARHEREWPDPLQATARKGRAPDERGCPDAQGACVRLPDDDADGALRHGQAEDHRDDGRNPEENKPSGPQSRPKPVSDLVPPRITHTITPAANALGWYNRPVLIQFTCSDAGSGVASCPAPMRVASEGQGQLVNVTARDRAGNVGRLQLSLDIDMTPPVMSPLQAQRIEATSSATRVQLVPPTVSDLLSGALPATSNLGGPLALGSHSLLWTARDRAGNVATQMQQLQVVDTTPPQLTIPPDVVRYRRQSPATIKLGIAQASDLFPPVVITSDAPAAFAPGVTFVHWSAVDANGNRSTAVQRVEFIVDTQPPVITASLPAATSRAALTVRGRVDEPCQLSINGQNIVLDATLGFIWTTTLQPGTNPMSFRAMDRAGNTAVWVQDVVLDRQPPPAADASLIQSSRSAGGAILLHGQAGAIEAGASLEIAQAGRVIANPTAAADGSFTARLGPATASPLSLVVIDAAGNRSQAVMLQLRIIPPDPVTIAPALSPQDLDTFQVSTAFLYEGRTPIQSGVVAGTIHADRAGVVRGQVLDRQGRPLAGVTLSVHGHPEYGRTLSRSDGTYDLAVNGGGRLTIDYDGQGLLPLQRTLAVERQAFAWAPDVVMTNVSTQASVVTMSAATPQVARGPMLGGRRATIFFPAGVSASLTMSDGTIHKPGRLTVRATEYTFGAHGPDAMPAELPASSGYTYAVELGADEASTAGAGEIRFSQPLPVYVEDFRGFPAGTLIPSGYYDRSRARWIPGRDGRVVAILGVDAAGLAELDVDGSGLAAGAAILSGLGIDAAERRQIAGLYGVGQRIWRVPVSHFTPWDFNLPTGPGTGAVPPDLSGARRQGEDTVDTPDIQCHASSIACQNQVLREEEPLVGIPFRLDYSSDRVPGHAVDYTLSIPLIGTVVPPELESILLRIEIAGQRHEFVYRYPSATPLVHDFVWDGRDAYGRRVLGARRAKVMVEYRYLGHYYAARPTFDRSFAGLAGAELALVQGTGGSGGGGGGQKQSVALVCTDLPMTFYDGSRLVPCQPPPIVKVRRRLERLLGHLAAAKVGLGGWTPSILHGYDPVEGVLYRGDGGRRRARGLPLVIVPLAGNGQAGLAGDGGPADQASMGRPEALALAPDGGLYVADPDNLRIRHVSPAGNMTTAVTGVMASGLAIGPDERLYLSDLADNTVKRLEPGGRLTIIAGGGRPASGIGDGGSAIQARLLEPHGLAFAADGGLLVVDTGHRRLRRIEGDGRIVTIAGGGTLAISGIAARDAILTMPFDVAIDSQERIYLSDRNAARVWRIDGLGQIHLFAGGGLGFAGDGGPANQAWLCLPEGLAIDREDRLVIADSCNHRLRRVNADGTITTIAGQGSAALSGDHGPAIAASLNSPTAVASDGNRILIADTFNHVVRLVKPALAGLGRGTTAITDRAGREVYVFDSSGRHLRTLDALTGGRRWSFGYDAQGLPIAITDGDGNTTTIDRDAVGLPVSLTSADGIVTSIGLDAQGRLQTLVNPAGERVGYTYDAAGLLTTRQDPIGGLTTLAYDVLGRLTLDRSAAGREWRLSHTALNDGFAVDKTSSLGRTTRFTIRRLADGATEQRRILPHGGLESDLELPDATTTSTAADGTITQSRMQGNPWLAGPGSLYRSEWSLSTPAGLSHVQRRLRQVRYTMGSVTLSETLDDDGRLWQTDYTQASHLMTRTSPAGRVRTIRLDAQGRVAEAAIPGRGRLLIGRDARGRITSLSQSDATSTRTSRLSYDGAGRVASLTDPTGQQTVYSYDLAGRLIGQRLADGRSIAFAYDANGRLVSISPPGRPRHALGRGPDGQLASYTAPALGPSGSVTRFAHDRDGRLVQIARPGGQTIDLAYDGAGRLQDVSTASTSTRLSYLPRSSRLSRIQTSDGVTLDLGYDGFLPISERWSGPVTGLVERQYDSSLRLTRLNVDGAPIDYAYDADGLLTQAGAETLTRDVASGLISATSIGQIETRFVRDGFGEEAAQTVTALGFPVYERLLTRDNMGRIVQTTETIHGTTRTEAYQYDATGRLMQVMTNGLVTASYVYDGNGNRIGGSDTAGPITASYDPQDRLVSYRGVQYTHAASGDLVMRNAAGSVTRYRYDARGALRQVTMADGTVIDYLIDGRGRRIGKQVNGVQTLGWIYQDGLNPIAELDATGNIRARFVYGMRRNIPDLMIQNGRTYRIISDERGSPRLVIDTGNGQIVQEMTYDAYGRITQDTHPGFQPFGFAGGLYDPQTGLARFGARDYDPETGRWTSKDPILFGGGDTNLYGYGLNDPINRVDSSGRFTALVGAAGGFVAGFVGSGLGSIMTGHGIIESISSAFKGGLFGGASGFLAGLCGGCAFGIYTGVGLDLLVNGSTGASIVNDVTPSPIRISCQ